MDSHRNHCFSTSSSPFPQKLGYQVKDTTVFVPIDGFVDPNKMNPQDRGCDMMVELTTLPLLLLTKIAELKNLGIT